MAKLTLNAIGSRYGSIDALNDNSDLIEAAFENTLSRDGTGPNNMEVDLDMDSNRVINLRDGINNQDAATVRQVNAIVAAASTGIVASLKERQDATSGQTVFNLSSIEYVPGSNNLSVYINGVRQYPGESYTETDSNTITFTSGLNLGAEVLFITNEAVDTANLQASAVHYTPAGVDAVPTNVQAKLRETVSVKDFGAVGDGVVDDTAAIQDALDSGANAVYFPSGTYSISASLNVSSNTAIYGDALTSIVESTTSAFDLFDIPTGSSNIAFTGLDFVGAATAAQATPQWAIYSGTSDASSDVSITNCRFRYVNNAIACGNGTRYRVEQCTFEHIMGVNPTTSGGAGNGYGVTSFGATGGYHTVSGNNFIGAAGEGRHAVYFTNGTSYCQITGNTVKDFNESNILVRAELPQPGVVGNIVDGNTCVGGGTAASAESGCITVSGVASNNAISNNTVSDFDNDGIVISHFSQGANCVRNYVSNNYVYLCGFRGIVVIGSPQTDVIGNRVYNCSQNTSGVHSGIDIRSTGSGGSGFAVDPADCNFIGNFVTGADHNYAFAINSSAPVPTNTNIVANTFNIGATPNFAVLLNMGAGVVPNYAWNITDQADASGFSDIKQSMSRNATLDFPSISANTTAELTRSITGVTTTGWVVVASPEGGVIESGLVWSAYVSAANTVTLRLANVTSGAINPASCVWRFDCFRHI